MVMGFRAGTFRASPWPYDMKMLGFGLMLGFADKGDTQLVSEKPQDQAGVVPSAYGYSAQNPRLEQVFDWQDLILGLGLKIQADRNDRRYAYAINADLSCGLWLKGPDITIATPATVDSTNGINRFFEIAGRVYAGNGRYALDGGTTASGWTVSKDFNADLAGQTLKDTIVYYTNAGGGANYAYAAMGVAANQFIYRFDGTTWTRHGSLQSSAWAVSGKELWRASGANTVAKVDTDADPWTAANWGNGNSFTIGDKAAPITRLGVTSTADMFILKTDGVYTLDQSGEDHNLFAHLKFAPDSAGGEPYGVWINDNYFTYGQSSYRMSPDYQLTEIGPDRLTTNDSPVRGRITAYCGHGSQCLYAGIWNPDTNTSYLMKYGAWSAGSLSQFQLQHQESQRLEVWHGAVSVAYAGKKIACLYKTTVGAPSGHELMLIGFSDGTIGSFTLPCTPNPAGCTSYRFSTATGSVYLPLWHGGFQADWKSLRGVTCTALNLSSTNYVQWYYRSAPSDSYTYIDADFNTGVKQKVTFPAGSATVYGDFRVDLISTTNTSCPQVLGFGLSNQLRTGLYQVYTVNVLAENGLVNRAGVPLKIGAVKIKALCEQAANTIGAINVTFADEGTKQVSVVDYKATEAWDERLGRTRAAVQLTLAQAVTPSTFGTYTNLEAYTYAQLEAYTYAQLETLV